MAQRSHVPKFGNWDGDNVPYTVYFENARKEKGGGARIIPNGARMNPNDPEENPELFMFGVEGASFSHSVQPPLQVNSEKSTSTESSQIEGHKPSHHRKVSNHRKNGSQKSMTSESGSEKSNSDNSIHQENHRRTRSDRKKSTDGGSNSNIFCPPSPGPNRFRSGTNPLEDTSLRAASVPMFGAWDERDPKSGEGFTVIFNKVKEEKQIAASTFPPVPTQPINQPNNQETNTKSKRCCCLF